MASAPPHAPPPLSSSSSSSNSPTPKSNARISASSTTDPILRNALRYTISAKEYETLHKYIISRSKVLRRNAPSVARVEKFERGGKDGKGHARGGGGEYNVAAVRASLRVFLVTAAGLRAWEVVKSRLLGARSAAAAGGKKVPVWKSKNFRLSLSLSTVLLLHRILFRFFTRLREQLLTDEARPFRQRNRRMSKTLTSSLAPAVGASLAGFALAVYPKDQLRVTIAIYALSQAAEFAYNLAEDEGWIWGRGGRPWWWGSWLLFPITSGQLLHAFVFDRDCFPTAYGNFILKYSPEYVQERPVDYPSTLPWPSTYEMVDSLAQTARLKYPPFISPILFPKNQTLPTSLTPISPITSPAHPLITSLTCATLHPSDPSCLRTYLTYWIRVFPQLARFFTLIFAITSIPSYRSFYSSPLSSLNRLASSVLRYTTFVAGSIGTSWGAICFFQHLFPATFLPTLRFFLGGMLGGMWGYVVGHKGRAVFLSSTRSTIDSFWKVGRKKGWWRGVRGGDVWLFVVSLMVVNAVFERDPKAVRSGIVRRGLSSLRGEGLRDKVREEEEKEKNQRKEAGKRE